MTTHPNLKNYIFFCVINELNITSKLEINKNNGPRMLKIIKTFDQNGTEVQQSPQQKNQLKIDVYGFQ